MKRLLRFLPVLLLAALAGRGSAQTSPLYPNVVSTTADPLLTNLNIPANAASQGMWSSTFAWPLVGIQSTVMPDGRVLTEGTPPGVTNTQDGRTLDFWSPMLGFATTSHFTAPNAQGVDSFCGSVSLLPGTGDVLLTGGGGSDGYSSFQSTLVTPSTTNIRNSGSTLAAQRWYSTMITLADGRALIGGGSTPYAIVGAYSDPNGSLSSISITPELYTPATASWQTLQNATSLDAFGPANNHAWYPRMWLAPDSSVFGISTEKVWRIDTTNWTATTLTNFKTTVDNTTLPNVGPTSTAVMYDVGKILQVGGNGYNNGYASTSSPYATIFDITNPQKPVITDTQAMHEGRQWANSLVMPDGQVLVTGGTTYADTSGANNVAATEMWNPATGAWQLGSSAGNYRGYHSSTVLLPNGTVLSVGGGVPGPVENTNGEIYYPPYLFTQSGTGSVFASRPRIVSVDNLQQNYGQTINLEMADNSTVVEASLVGLSSTTHSFNSFQRRIKLAISQSGVVTTLTMPQSSGIAPPGYYLLTVLNKGRVPSTAVIVSINAKAVAQQGITVGTPTTPPVTVPTSPQIGQGFSKVAAASDGTLVGISTSSNLLYMSKSDGTATSVTSFTLMPNFAAKDVAVLSATSVYAIGMDNTVWHYSAGTWTQVGINGLSIAASPDGMVALSNNVDNTTYLKPTDDNQNNWYWVPVRSKRVALVNRSSLYYIGQDGNAYRTDNVNAPIQINSGVADIAASSDGRVSVVTVAGTVQTKLGDNTVQNWTALAGISSVSRIGTPNQNTLVLTYTNGNVYFQSTTATQPAKSASAVTIQCSGTFTYNGTAQTPCSATVTGSGGLNQAVSVTYSNNRIAGVATASAQFAGDATHTGSSNSATFTIAPAPLTVTAGSYTGVYDGNTHAPSACQVSTNFDGLTCTNQPTTVGPNAGSGTITPAVSGATANYAVTTVNGTWTITTAATTTPSISANSPVMGWASWNSFASLINYNVIKAQVDAMVSSGLASSKYVYVNLDEGWWQGQRDSNGNMVVNTTQWPGGMQAIAAYIHSKGLKAGIYSDAGRDGCGYYYPTGSPAAPGTGMEGHEYQDALQFQNWGFDFVKVDWCGGQAEGLDPQSTYQKVSAAITQASSVSGKSLVLSICDWGVNQPWNWAPGISAMWRTSTDIIFWGNSANATNILTNFDASLHPTSQHTGYVNDPDMLTIGMPGLTDAQNRMHLGLWAVAGAPLVLGNDLTKMTPATVATLTNPRAIAVDQDALGLQGIKVAEDVTGLQVYSKTLAGSGKRAVVLLNRTANAANIAMRWTDMGLTSGSASFQDVWTGSSLGTATAGTSINVAAGDAAFLLISGSEAPVTTYEAEATQNTFTGSAGPSTCPTCSQGKNVRYVGNGATLSFNAVNATSSGLKLVTVQYINGDATPRTATLQVNGQLGTPVMFPPTGSWSTVGSVSLIASFNSGATNTLTFGNSKAWTPDFDSITVQNNQYVATGNALVGVQSGRCINTPTGANVNGTQLQLQDCNSSPSQMVTITAAGELRIYGNMCVDAYNNGTQSGTVVDLWPCNGQTNQKWTFNSNGTITGNQSGLCLDASSNNTANGTPIQLWACNNGKNQQWLKQ